MIWTKTACTPWWRPRPVRVAAHRDGIRIHPFANGNGRTARQLANSILERYGLPPVLRTRPRPAGSYVIAATLGTRGGAAPMQRFILQQILLRTRGEP